MMRAMRGVALLLLLAACADDAARQRHGHPDASFGDVVGDDGGARDLAGWGSSTDLAGKNFSTGDLSGVDLSGGAADLAGRDLSTGGGGVISGGPCQSGAAGATALRVHWINAGGTAQVQYEAFGLPDHSRETVSAAGYQIGFTPQWDDPFLGDGGLVLDSSDFVDLELSMAGLATINSATLAIRGRSFNTTASGSFNWLSFTGSGATADDFVANSAPYQWYPADIAGAVAAGDSGFRLRIKAGPSSDSLIVNRIELCMDAR
jgi:hypothetical protein